MVIQVLGLSLHKRGAIHPRFVNRLLCPSFAWRPIEIQGLFSAIIPGPNDATGQRPRSGPRDASRATLVTSDRGRSMRHIRDVQNWGRGGLIGMAVICFVGAAA